MDPRLAHEGSGSVIRSLSEVWNPRLTIINTQKYWANTRDEVEISPDGLVTYRLHVFGDFSQALDLHDFPQDSHVFEVPVVAADYRPHEVVLLPDPRMDSFMALIEVVVTSNFSSTDRLVTARRIDRTARWLFPLLFVSALAYSFII
jgi:hypothetical protein